ncbi:hypothetical protein PG993_015089 [Apiospora rasikravindrae]|uniref:Uncharacterized protein n=1 Tax=Apiospora rasikravindrae TaxID=990691 RepID=A0ABR1RPN9_9PEZI
MGATASVPRDRTRQLQVIDAGYARTATLSYSLALSRLLDGPVMHGGTQLFHREDSYCRQLDALYRLRRAPGATVASSSGRCATSPRASSPARTAPCSTSCRSCSSSTPTPRWSWSRATRRAGGAASGRSRSSMRTAGSRCAASRCFLRRCRGRGGSPLLRGGSTMSK